ncbi:hypothetical protein EJB05_08775 [Eragrostis curvula]|uniref:Uncharacterized protein n=1 Tax=Eragrostis curvula TaxID=38414 RepID=A0A5J9W374_9POAL|nr:hypothetical protein EJB05_08775 [Eragrostis curvula]
MLRRKSDVLVTTIKESCEFNEYVNSAIQVTPEPGAALVNPVVGGAECSRESCEFSRRLSHLM